LKHKNEKEFRLFKTYDICYYSGELGPKRKQGDGQVPEGFYKIEAFNPYSNYHLSLRVSYPNASDKIIGKVNLGGDIMIHGNCVSIGCVPITDTYIKELYILAVEAKNGGQDNIPIHIFPGKLDKKGMEFLNGKYPENSLQNFWKNLKNGYDYFEENKKLPKIEVDKSGKYVFL
jgi:murein L,D-transpeptidase YafK